MSKTLKRTIQLICITPILTVVTSLYLMLFGVVLSQIQVTALFFMAILAVLGTVAAVFLEISQS